MSNFHEFKAYGVWWGAGHDWRALPDNDESRIEALVEETEAPAHVVVHMGDEMGVRVGLVDKEPSRKKTVSMPALLLSKINTPESSYIVLTRLDDGGVYKMRVQNSNVYEDKAYSPEEAESIIESAFSSGYAVFCDSRIAEMGVPDESGETRAFEMKKVVGKKNSLKDFRYHFNNRGGWLKNLLLTIILFSGMLFLADELGLIAWLTKDSDVTVSAKTVTKSKEQIEREITELMKETVSRSLKSDTEHPGSKKTAETCNQFRLKMPVTIFGWEQTKMNCTYHTFLGEYRRTIGAAPFDEVSVMLDKDNRIPKNARKRLSHEILALIMNLDLPVLPAMTRNELPARETVMAKLYRFAQTRSDLRYRIEVKDAGMKPLNVIYEKKTIKVRQELNYGLFVVEIANHPIADIYALLELLGSQATNIKRLSFNPNNTVNLTVEFFYI